MGVSIVQHLYRCLIKDERGDERFVITESPLPGSVSTEIAGDDICNYSEFDIFVNNPDKQYGFTEVSDIEGKYLVETYKDRLEILRHVKLYDAISEMWNMATKYSDKKAATWKEAVEQHFSWWLVSPEDVPENIKVFDLSDEDIFSLLREGFMSDMVFVRRKDLY